MNKWLSILVGLVLILAPILLVGFHILSGWGRATIEFVKGGLVIGVIMFGLLFLLLGISELRG